MSKPTFLNVWTFEMICRGRQNVVSREGMKVMTDFKRISDALNREDKKYLERMNQYLEELRALPPDKAKIEARRAFIRTGVLDIN